MSWTTAVELLIVWSALALPLAIIVGRVAGRTGDACPAAPHAAVSSDLSGGVSAQLVSGPTLTT